MKYDKSHLEKILSKFGMENLTKSMIIFGIKSCVDHDIHHVDLIMKKVYKTIAKNFGDTAIESRIYDEVKAIDDEDVYLELGYLGHLTSKKLFILLLEKYDQ